jgi:hypothetical protein
MFEQHKKLAQKIQKSLKGLGYEVSLGHSYEVLSHTNNYESWNHYKAAIEKKWEALGDRVQAENEAMYQSIAPEPEIGQGKLTYEMEIKAPAIIKNWFKVKADTPREAYLALKGYIKQNVHDWETELYDMELAGKTDWSLYFGLSETDQQYNILDRGHIFLTDINTYNDQGEPYHNQCFQESMGIDFNDLPGKEFDKEGFDLATMQGMVMDHKMKMTHPKLPVSHIEWIYDDANSDAGNLYLVQTDDQQNRRITTIDEIREKCGFFDYDMVPLVQNLKE